MVKQEMISDEIIVVGSRYGYFADKLIPLFDEGNPIEVANIKKLFGSDKVLLSPDGSNSDPYAVAVYTDSQQRIGYVWMHQSPSICQWIKDHSKEFVRAHLKRVIVKGGLMVAEPDIPLKLVRQARLCPGLDMNWAAKIPETMASLTEQSIGLGMALLMDELESATTWSPHLQMRIDNLLQDLPHDLSAHNYQKGKLLIETMHRSDIAEVRQHCDEVLASFVYRGSKAQMTWWVEHWLPDFFRDVADNVLGVYEAANYTLERIEELLNEAPNNLFFLYKANRLEFAFRLYYSALPQSLYTRLLTLLSVREAMLAKRNGMTAVPLVPSPSAQPDVLPSKDLMRQALNTTMHEGLWWSSRAWAVVYRLYQIKGYRGGYSHFISEVQTWKINTGFQCSYDAVQKPITSGKLMGNPEKWAGNGAPKAAVILGCRLMELLP